MKDDPAARRRRPPAAGGAPPRSLFDQRGRAFLEQLI